MYTVTEKTSISAIYGYSALLGIGGGCINQAAYSIVPTKVVPAWHHIPASIGFVNVAQIGGIMHSLAISGVVFQNYAFKNLSLVLAGLSFSESEIRSAISGTESTIFASIDPTTKAAAISAIVQAMRKVYILSIAAGAICLLCSFAMRREKLFGKP
jgi:DMSO reductase anchor subunit